MSFLARAESKALISLQVAVKIVDRRKAPKDYLKKFLPREIEVLQKLDHPRCVSFLFINAKDSCSNLSLQFLMRVLRLGFVVFL